MTKLYAFIFAFLTVVALVGSVKEARQYIAQQCRSWLRKKRRKR